MTQEEANIQHTLAQTRLVNAQAAHIEAALGGAAPKSLAADVPAKTSKAKAKAEAATPPAATPAAAPAAPAAAAPAPAGLTKEADEASKKLALDTASAYVRHFSKSVPDGMVRARTVLGEKFAGKKIAELVHDERLKFVDALKKEMEPAGAAA